MNKIKEGPNTAVFKLNVIIGLGALFFTNYGGHFNEGKEFRITLTIPDFSREQTTSNIG